MVMEFGIGTDIRGEDYTKAAARAVKGGLNVPREGDRAPVVIVNTGLVVRVPV